MRMPEQIVVAAAGNVLPAALAALRKMGFSVTRLEANLLEASKPGYRFLADEPIVLLGLAKLVEERGAEWRPTDAEVDAALEFEGTGRSHVGSQDR